MERDFFVLDVFGRSTTVRLNDSRGSEQYHVMNSSIAWPYDSCELMAPSEFKTALFECSRSKRRRTVLGRFSFRFRAVGCACPILAASSAANSVWKVRRSNNSKTFLRAAR